MKTAGINDRTNQFPKTVTKPDPSASPSFSTIDKRRLSMIFTYIIQ